MLCLHSFFFVVQALTNGISGGCPDAVFQGRKIKAVVVGEYKGRKYKGKIRMNITK